MNRCLFFLFLFSVACHCRLHGQTTNGTGATPADIAATISKVAIIAEDRERDLSSLMGRAASYFTYLRNLQYEATIQAPGSLETAMYQFDGDGKKGYGYSFVADAADYTPGKVPESLRAKYKATLRLLVKQYPSANFKMEPDSNSVMIVCSPACSLQLAIMLNWYSQKYILEATVVEILGTPAAAITAAPLASPPLAPAQKTFVLTAVNLYYPERWRTSISGTEKDNPAGKFQTIPAMLMRCGDVRKGDYVLYKSTLRQVVNADNGYFRFEDNLSDLCSGTDSIPVFRGYRLVYDNGSWSCSACNGSGGTYGGKGYTYGTTSYTKSKSWGGGVNYTANKMAVGEGKADFYPCKVCNGKGHREWHNTNTYFNDVKQ